MIKIRNARSLAKVVMVASLAWALASPMAAENRAGQWPRRVLITNDDGIEDTRLIKLARAFAQESETFVAAPIGDRSRSSNYFSLGRMGPGLRLESRKLGKGIVAWGVHGFPADCVLFALMGPMRGQPPDLVVSGVNSGPNLGVEWFFSGTIGAARTAAFLGVPAIAVSGLDDSMPGAIKAVNRWVVALARSPVVRDLEPGQYLTVSFPEVPPSQIVGVRVVPRAALDPTKFPTLDRVEESTLASEEWRIQAPSRTMNLDEGDEEAFRSRFIAVVPMRVGEQDHARLMELQKNEEMLPSWPP